MPAPAPAVNNVAADGDVYLAPTDTHNAVPDVEPDPDGPPIPRRPSLMKRAYLVSLLATPIDKKLRSASPLPANPTHARTHAQGTGSLIQPRLGNLLPELDATCFPGRFAAYFFG